MEAQCEGNLNEKFIPLLDKCDGMFKGNPDEKFIQLENKCDGEFKDPSGRQYVYYNFYQQEKLLSIIITTNTPYDMSSVL